MIELVFLSLVACLVLFVACLIFSKQYKNIWFYLFFAIMMTILSSMWYVLQLNQGYAKVGLNGVEQQWYLISYSTNKDDKTITVFLREAKSLRFRLVEFHPDKYDETLAKFKDALHKIDLGALIMGTNKSDGSNDNDSQPNLDEIDVTKLMPKKE